jgi:crossover junction endodeoxyribonuclease RuvC
VLGIDPGSRRTGYGCVDSDGRRHRLVLCGAITATGAAAFTTRLAMIFRELSAVLRDCQPECVAIENLFHATNVRSALKLGHARGVAMLAAVEAGLPVVEYTPAEIKRAIVGYGRAEKPQVQRMIKLLLGLERVPAPHDAADALAVAICHLHAGRIGAIGLTALPPSGRPHTPALSPVIDVAPGSRQANRKAMKSWRQYRPPPDNSRA